MATSVFTAARAVSAIPSSRPGSVKSSVRAPARTNVLAAPRRSTTTTVVRVSAPRSSERSGSTLNPFNDCVERTDSAAIKDIAAQYFAKVGEANPSLQSIMTDDCVMTDRVLGWCFRGREAVEGHFRDFHAKYCSHEFSHLDVLTNLDSRTVCAHWALTVCTREEDAPCVPDYQPSRRFQINGVHLFTLDSDNKIANITTYRTACTGDENFDY